MLQESEYAAWVLCNGYNLNHTTVAVHKLEHMRWMLAKPMCCLFKRAQLQKQGPVLSAEDMQGMSEADHGYSSSPGLI